MREIMIGMSKTKEYLDTTRLPTQWFNLSQHLYQLCSPS